MTIPNAYLRNWLLDTRSLTERLQSQCQHFDLDLLGQRQMAPELEEIRQLSSVVAVNQPQKWQIREVLLKGNQQPWVFARSVICEELCQADFAGLGVKPLGQIIFNDKRFNRHPFQLMRIARQHPLLNQLSIPRSFELWGRRSVFTFEQYALMVAEIFLPDSPAYQQMEGN